MSTTIQKPLYGPRRARSLGLHHVLPPLEEQALLQEAFNRIRFSPASEYAKLWSAGSWSNDAGASSILGLYLELGTDGVVRPFVSRKWLARERRRHSRDLGRRATLFEAHEDLLREIAKLESEGFTRQRAYRQRSLSLQALIQNLREAAVWEHGRRKRPPKPGIRVTL